jgi:hypothetical protein
MTRPRESPGSASDTIQVSEPMNSAVAAAPSTKRSASQAP